MMFKNITKILFLLLLFFFSLGPVKAQDNINIYFFWGDGCPHCTKQKPFLEKMEAQYPQVKVHAYEVWKVENNRRLLIEVGKSLQSDVSGVPFTVIGDKAFVGFSEPHLSGQMEERVRYCIENDCPDSVALVVGLSDINDPPPQEVLENNAEVAESEGQELIVIVDDKKEGVMPDEINFPIIGSIKTRDLSLPVFTIVLGALDGFNPCAMWTLVFLISLLVGMEDKRRRWILGIAFIAASASVYFFFMAAWLNLILFIGFIVWVRALIALIAVGGGIYNLREYFVNKEGACKVTGGEKRRAVFENLKKVTLEKKFLLALGGIILLAFAVNLVELICSAGLPVVFTQVLVLSSLPPWQNYAYMVLYVFIFMLDDLFVFFTAMMTLEITGMSSKYTRYSHLIGGILMIIIGLLLLFKPEWLMFS